MQLVAYGAQDIYLTGNPQITFFKVVYRRHTNFSMEAIKQTFNGTSDFGSSATATISRNGDLVYRMYLEHKCKHKRTDASTGGHMDIGLVERYGHSLIKECEIEIGGQRIDKHTSMWNRVYSDLTEFNPSGHFGAGVAPSDAGVEGNGTLYQLMTGNGYGINTNLNNAGGGANEFGIKTNGNVINGFTYKDGASGPIASIDIGTIFLPLNFWFCRNPGLALPLIALQYHEVKVKMTFEQLTNLVRLDDSDDFNNPVAHDATCEETGKAFNLWCDYIYLDTDERRRFAQVSHEYLIEQLQYSENTVSTASPSIDLNFNHPVKELVWCMRNVTASDTDGGRHQPLTSALGDVTASQVSLDEMGGNWQLKLNGHDRFKERDTRYFTKTQLWQHHTGYGGLPTKGDDDAEPELHSGDAATTVGADSIAVYSFALKPEEHQPSGTCNFSRIDNAQLVGSSLQVCASVSAVPGLANIGTTGATSINMTIFAVNYNVLRIMSGMGGLAYSN